MSIGGNSELEFFGPGAKMTPEYYNAHQAEIPKPLEISPERIDTYNKVCQMIEKSYSDEEGSQYKSEIIKAKALKKNIEKITRLEESLSKLLAIEPKPEDTENYKEYVVKTENEIQDLKLKLGESHV